MIYLSENTLSKYNQGYKKASTVLADYINKSRQITEVLAEKAGNDPATNTEISKPEKIEYYKLKTLNIKRRKGLITATYTPKRNFSKVGIITLSGKPYGKTIGYLYTDENGNKYMIPEKEHTSLFGL